MGAAVGDYDNDGDLDLLVTSFGPETLYRNNGNGTFTDVTKEANVSDPLWSTSAAFFDYDRDGDLDLFVANYLDFTIAGNKTCTDTLGAPDYCGPRNYRPVPDRLYRNDGNGRFTDVTEASGISRADGAGLGVVAADYNNDGWLDLYVANDATPNQLWINRHDGTFTDEGLLSGAALNAAGNPEGSMGIASGDFDADGDEDLFVTNIIGETFVLYRNDGPAISRMHVSRPGWQRRPQPSPGSAPTGSTTTTTAGSISSSPTARVNAIESQRGQPTPFRMKNQLFHNTGNGTLRGTSARRAGLRTRRDRPRRRIRRHRQRWRHRHRRDDQRRAGAAADQPEPEARITGSKSSPQQRPRNRSRRSARGVGVERAGQPTLWRRVHSDGSYLAASDFRVQFGLGSDARITAVVVQWPDGASERWTDVRPDQRVTLRRGTGREVK